jgi:hypothetical protein
MVYHRSIASTTGTGHVQGEVHHSQQQFQDFCTDTNKVGLSLLQSCPLYHLIPENMLAAVNHKQSGKNGYRQINISAHL